MKIGMWIVMMLFPVTLLAQAVGGSGSTGGGLMRMRTLKYGCEEGRVASQWMRQPNGKYELSRRMCTNGSYMTAEERAAYKYIPKKLRCIEGDYRWSMEIDEESGQKSKFLHQCRNQKWIVVQAYYY